MYEVATEVMQANKAAELFQTMEIVSLNMGNLNLEVNILKKRSAIEEKEKAILQMEFGQKEGLLEGVQA